MGLIIAQEDRIHRLKITRNVISGLMWTKSCIISCSMIYFFITRLPLWISMIAATIAIFAELLVTALAVAFIREAYRKARNEALGELRRLTERHERLTNLEGEVTA